MSPPAFWWRPDPSFAAIVLSPVAAIVAAVATRRMRRPARLRPKIPVICVGNFVVGGAGKTPTALKLAEIARGLGRKPGFVASGYGGSAAGAVRVDPGAHEAATVGDEALLLAAEAPTAVGPDRAAAAKLLTEADVDLVIMDDGLQNPYVAKDLRLGCVDAGAGIGNGMVLPAGPLRAPLAAQLERIDAVVLVGDGRAADSVTDAVGRRGRAVLRARLAPSHPSGWQDQPILAFAGIGRPQKFFDTLTAVGAPVGKAVGFLDHHVFTDREATRLLADADAGHLRLVTTEKDRARLVGATGAGARLRDRAEAFAVVLEFEEPDAIAKMVADTVARFEAD